MHSLAGLSISPGEISQAKFLGANNQFCRKLLEAFSTPTDEPSNEKLELEETIYSGFASSLASRQMQDFHAAAGDQKVKIARSFDDKRFRSLAMRMLYVENPNCMTAEEKGLIEQGIARRLRGLPNGQHKWRAVADALNELEQANADTSSTSTTMLREWLIGRMAEGK